LKSLAKVT